MSARILFGIIWLLCTLSGCLSDPQHLATVPMSGFGSTSRTSVASFKQAPPATQEIALRVDRVGKQLLTANPNIKQKVVFGAAGLQQEEIFHQGQKDVSAIWITEGLVKQCKTDGELAALLSMELGKLVSEQMAQLKPARRSTPASLMMNPRIGNDANGTFGSPDGTDQLILRRMAKEQQQIQTITSAPPAADVLARLYLKDAGFDAKNLDTVAPLLRKAEKQNSAEMSMSGKWGN
jgi:hypothetical protein